jgi:2-polyprenyl-6-methoxyphenol hydroxylase-like FAD-dependent oxidoreductase
MEGYSSREGYMINRGELVWVLFGHAQSLGIDIRLGSLVTEYWETKNEAGVVVNGERIAADCVICADGVHSSARLPVVGHEPTAHEMGIATFRGYYDAKELMKNSEASWVLEGTEYQDTLVGYYGDGAHIMIATLKNGKEVFWMCVHEVGGSCTAQEIISLIEFVQDVHRSSESWDNNGADIENAVNCIKDWPCRHKLEPVIRQTPKESFIDRQLIARDPLKTWVSPHQRMILIGDAAHPSLPAAGQGGGQAIEDGAVVAITLELAGKDNVPLALCAVEKIR